MALGAVGFAGCGGDDDAASDLPAGVVVKINNATITKPFYKREAALIAQYRARDPHNPGFSSQTLRDGLIRTEWLKLEAARRHIPLPTGPEDAQGLSTMGKALITAVVGDNTPTDREARSYYVSHRKDFFLPEARIIRLIDADTRATAQRAATHLPDTDPFAGATAKYSDRQQDPSEDKGLIEAQRKDLPPQLAKAVFDAQRNQTQGPLQVQTRWYTFKVIKTRATHQQTLAEVRPDINKIVGGHANARIYAKYERNLPDRYTPRTICAPTYRSTLCSDS